jgi:hypothetical protein
MLRKAVFLAIIVAWTVLPVFSPNQIADGTTRRQLIAMRRIRQKPRATKRTTFPFR